MGKKNNRLIIARESEKNFTGKADFFINRES
jgi:hypothetical protein